MATPPPFVYVEPSSGINLVPLPANLVPATFVPTPNQTPIPPANSLTKLAELQSFLLQCDQPSYFKNYYDVRNHNFHSFSTPLTCLTHKNTKHKTKQQLLSTASPSHLQSLVQSLIERACWLDSQQDIELDRMRATEALPEPLTATVTATGSIAKHLAADILENIYTHSHTQQQQQEILLGSLDNKIKKKDRSGGTTPATTTTTGVVAAVEHHQLSRDVGVTPPSMTALPVGEIAPEGNKNQGKVTLKRKKRRGW